MLWFGACLSLLAILKRRVIGAQDSKEGLITSGLYRFSRHPIYFGIIMISLSFPLIGRNIDGMIVFPFVFLANFFLASIEEKYDIGRRFKKEYDAYRKQTAMIAPLWFWLISFIIISSVLIIGILS